jgi:hypothetical protein
MTTLVPMSFRRWLRTQYNPRACEVFFPLNPRIGALFTSRPWIVFCVFSLCALLLLVIPSFTLRLALIAIPDGDGGIQRIGFMQRFNWGVNYLTILPFTFALAALASRSFKRGLLVLLRRPPTIQPSPGKRYENYLTDFRIQTAARTKHLFVVCLMITLVITIIDSWHNLRGYGSAMLFHHAFHSDEIDWMNAAFIPANSHWSSHIAPWQNLLFYLVALSFQGSVICLGLVWISSFWIHSRVFADLMLRSDFDYRFVPWEKDPDHRLGLKPIGFVFSTFLVGSVLLQIYVYLHRLQVMHKSLWPYFKEVAATFAVFDKKSPVETIGKALDAWWPLNGLRQVNPGVVLLILCGPILSITIAWWPIVRLGHYIDLYREGLIRQYKTETQKAKDEGELDKAADLDAKINGLAAASVWPNGYAIGWGTFSVLLVLEVAAIFPALLPILIVSGLLLKVAKFFMKSKSKS